MNGVIVTVLICSASLSRADCTAASARAHFSFHSDFLVCGIPANFSWASTGVAPGPDETIRIICRTR
jgi:hypothetical protein